MPGSPSRAQLALRRSWWRRSRRTRTRPSRSFGARWSCTARPRARTSPTLRARCAQAQGHSAEQQVDSTAPPPGVTLTAPPPERYAHRSPAQSPVLPRPPPPPIDVTSDGAGSSSSHAASPLYESQTPIPEEDAKLCVVCLDWERTFAVVPCGHHCLCQDCLDKVLASDRQCPVCREPMQGIGAIRIYF